jgi:hypothetical protein
MNYKKHFAKTLNIDPSLIVGFTLKDGNHTNSDLSNMLLIVDPIKYRDIK